MCGRYQLALPFEDVEAVFNTRSTYAFEQRYNIAPTQTIPFIRQMLGQRVMDSGRWGLIPPWSKDGLKTKPLINARSETASQKPSFRNALHQGRCLVPATGFYEWRREGRAKTPHLIRLKDQPVFAMAGIGHRWRGPEGLMNTIAILTVDPNGALGDLHHRMPVILDPSSYERWLDPTASRQEIEGLLKPIPGHELSIIQVSDRVNGVAHDDPSCQKPAHVQPRLL